MITYGFFDSVAGDRKYSAEDIGFYLHGLITSGVYEDDADSLQVLAGTGMQLEVRPGRAMLEYHWLKNDEPLQLQLSAGGSMDRIDIVVARLDLDARLCEIAVKEGTPSATPTRPIMLRSDFVKEYILAEIYVTRLSTAITQNDITDKRADDTVCGWVRAMIRDGAGVPAPAASDVGKALVAKANGAGYELKSVVQKSGDTMTGPLDMGGQKITTLGPPEIGTDAATADYVKNQIKENVTNKTGKADGLASLDSTGKVPTDQLPDDFSITHGNVTSRNENVEVLEAACWKQNNLAHVIYAVRLSTDRSSFTIMFNANSGLVATGHAKVAAVVTNNHGVLCATDAGHYNADANTTQFNFSVSVPDGGLKAGDILRLEFSYLSN